MTGRDVIIIVARLARASGKRQNQAQEYRRHGTKYLWEGGCARRVINGHELLLA